MGLFGSKIPKEEKQYQKVLKDALHKPNTKNINEMKSALASYPNGWQGYWICAVYYDQGFDKVARDEVMAQEYFRKAEEAARGTEHEVWLQEFLRWYRRDAGHLEKPLTEEMERARRLGIALCYCSLLGNEFLTAPYEKYGEDWYVMSQGILGRMDSGYEVVEPFSDFVSIADFDRNSQIKDTNKFIEHSNKSVEAYTKCLNAIRDEKEPNWEKYNDMYDYLIAVNCIHGGKLLTEEVAANSDYYMNETDMGIFNLLTGSFHGCQPAIHELVRLAKGNQDNFDIIERAFQNRKLSQLWAGDLEKFLAEQLKKCIDKNDVEAKRLYQMYYQ